MGVNKKRKDCMLCDLYWCHIEITTTRVTCNHFSGNFPIRTTDFHKMDDGSSYRESAQQDSQPGHVAEGGRGREREGEMKMHF